MIRKTHTTAIILAGGRSTRLGHDKRQLRLWGTAGPTLLAHTVQRAAALCDPVLVILHDPEQWAALSAPGIVLLRDAYPGDGPLGGLATGLAASSTPRALLLACDMPLLPVPLLGWLADHTDDADALVLAAADGRPEPLVARYATHCLPQVTTLLAAGERRMTALLNTIQPTLLPPRTWQNLDPAGHALLNLNRAEDLDRIARIIAG